MISDSNDPSHIEQAFRRGTRPHLLQPGEKAVEPEPGRLARNPSGDQERVAVESDSSSDPSRTATPMTIDASARLNAGHQRRSRKSVT